MGYEYIPEKWRKKFKEGQTVWIISDLLDDDYAVKRATFDRYCEHRREYDDTVYVERPDWSRYTEQVTEDWVFTRRSDAKKELQSILGNEIEELEAKLKRLKKKKK